MHVSNGCVIKAQITPDTMEPAAAPTPATPIGPIPSPCTNEADAENAIAALAACAARECPSVNVDNLKLKDAPNQNGCKDNTCNDVLECKKNKNWACGNYKKLMKVNDECIAASSQPVTGSACLEELEAAEKCVIEALINDYYDRLTCTVVRGADAPRTGRGDAAAAT